MRPWSKETLPAPNLQPLPAPNLQPLPVPNLQQSLGTLTAKAGPLTLEAKPKKALPKPKSWKQLAVASAVKVGSLAKPPDPTDLTLRETTANKAPPAAVPASFAKSSSAGGAPMPGNQAAMDSFFATRAAEIMAAASIPMPCSTPAVNSGNAHQWATANGFVPLSAPMLAPLPTLERFMELPQVASSSSVSSFPSGQGVPGGVATLTQAVPGGVATFAQSIQQPAMHPNLAPQQGSEASAPQQASAACFNVGQKVEYWSATHAKWVPSRVKKIHRGPDGFILKYDLDSKPNAIASKVRIRVAAARDDAKAVELADQAVALATGPAQSIQSQELEQLPGVDVTAAYAKFKVGNKVEYWSKQKSKWLSAVVKADRLQEGLTVYDLSCSGLDVRGAPPERLRPRQSAAHARKRKSGSVTGATSLKRKKGAPGNSITTQSASAVDDDADVWAALEEAEGSKPAQKEPHQKQKLVFREEGKSKNQGEDHSKSSGPKDVKHKTGDHVEFCNDQGKWVPAVVKSVSLNAKGNVMFYDLDCQQAVRPGEVRRPSPAAIAAVLKAAAAAGNSAAAGSSAPVAAQVVSEVFAVGDRVRYWSATHSKWVPAKVKEVYKLPNGEVLSYDLNLKPKAELSLVRNAKTKADAPPPQAKQQAGAADGQPAVANNNVGGTSRVYEVGSKVQYWSKQESSWLDAVVQAKREQDGGVIVYDLDCKKMIAKGAMADRLRPPPAHAAS